MEVCLSKKYLSGSSISNDDYLPFTISYFCKLNLLLLEQFKTKTRRQLGRVKDIFQYFDFDTVNESGK